MNKTTHVFLLSHILLDICLYIDIQVRELHRKNSLRFHDIRLEDFVERSLVVQFLLAD